MDLKSQPVKSSLFTVEQNELLDLIFQNHTSQIKEFLREGLKTLETGFEKDLYTNIEKIRQEIGACKNIRDEKINLLEKQVIVLDTKFKIKSSLWGLLGGLIPALATAILYILMKVAIH